LEGKFSTHDKTGQAKKNWERIPTNQKRGIPQKKGETLKKDVGPSKKKRVGIRRKKNSIDFQGKGGSSNLSERCSRS